MAADNPDDTVLSCSVSVLDVSTPMTCTIVPRKAGATIYALSSFFSVSVSSGVASVPFPTASNLLTFNYTAASTTSVANVSDGRFSSFSIIIVGAAAAAAAAAAASPVCVSVG
jgi:hypothetical protein